MSDYISRQAAIDAMATILDNPNHAEFLYGDEICKVLNELPSIQTERKKGKWELKEDILSWEGTFDGYFCSECGKGFLNDLCCNNGADWVDVQKDFKFCPFCGADMRTKETDRDYERAVEQLEHDMLYEPTYNPDDGSM